LINDDEAYEKLNTALTGLSGTLNQIDQIRLTLGGGADVQVDSGDYRGYVNLALTPRENKSYIFEVVNDPRGKVQKTVNLTTVNGVTTEVENISFETKVKFSLEYFRRFGDVGLYGGLIENSFGFGADYFFDDPGLKLSLQLWDFSSDDPLNGASTPKPPLDTISLNICISRRATTIPSTASSIQRSSESGLRSTTRTSST
jgi:phospholipid/cholesterol/gamma-HCH transport system substrate-binding protein